MELTWKEVSNVVPTFPNLKELVLKANNCLDFGNITFTQSDLPKLRYLNLEDNNLLDFSGILEKFGDWLSLQELNLNHNQLAEIGKIYGFKELREIFLEFNEINIALVLQQLNQFPMLANLRIKNNPIQKKLGASYVRQRAIAEISKLDEVNGSEIKKFERKDCEIYYMRKTFEEYFKKVGRPHYDYEFEDFQAWCIGRHPRLPFLIARWGNPYEVSEEAREMLKKEKIAGVGGLVTLKLSASAGPFVGQDPRTKKFPQTTTIQTLKQLLSQMFNLNVDRLIVYYHSDPNEPFQILDDGQRDLQFYSVKQDGAIWVDI